MIGKSAVAGNIDDETVVQRSMKWWYTSTSSHGSAASYASSVSTERILTSEPVTNAERAQVQDVSSGVRVPRVPVEITGKKDSVVEIALRVAKKSDMGIKTNTYHEDSATKLELERSIGPGNVESLQNERSWNLSRVMRVPEVTIRVE